MADGNGQNDLRIVLYATIDKTKSKEQLKDDLEKIKRELESSNATKIEMKLELAQSEIKRILDELKKIQPPKIVIGEVDDRQLTEAMNKVENLFNKLKQLNEYKISLGAFDTRQLDQAEKAMENVRKETEKVREETEKANKEARRFREIGVAKNLDDINSAKQELQQLYSEMLKANAEVTDFRLVTDRANKSLYRYTVQVKESSGEVKNFKGEINKTTGAIREQIIQIKKHDSEMDMMANRFKTALVSVPVWMGAMTAIYGPINALQQLMSIAIEVDKQMTEMKRVMDQDTNFNQVLQGNIEMAKELSRSLQDVNKSYIEFVKQGLSESQAREMSRAALLAQNVSDLSSDEAIQSLTAAITQFKLQAKDAMSVVDKWNEVKMFSLRAQKCA